MKGALALLAFSMLVLAMFGGVPRTTGNYVNPVKQRAIDNVNSLNQMDVEIRENDFLIDLSSLSNYDNVPLLVSGSEVNLMLDFSFLGDSAFTGIDSYVNYFHFTAFLETEEETIQAEITPTGFLEYSVSFSVPEGETGLANIGYKTKSWSKSQTVYISESTSAESLKNLVISVL